MKGSEAHAVMPLNERSRISGWDARKAAKSGSSLAGSISILRLNGRERNVETDAPHGRREGAQPEGSIAGEYPRERAVSIFVDGYFHVESAETRQEPQHLVDEQLEREQDSVVAKVEGETLDELASLCGGISEREQEPHGARRREFPDVAVQDPFSDGVERVADEEQWMEVVWPGEKGQDVVDEFQGEGHQGGAFEQGHGRCCCLDSR